MFAIPCNLSYSWMHPDSVSFPSHVQLKEPLSAPSDYTVNVADAKSLQAVKAQLGDLEAIEYQDAE